jgi:general secretion pathway protein E
MNPRHREELPNLAGGLTREFLLHRRLSPRRFDGDATLIVAVAPDALLDDLDDLSWLYQRRIVTEPATREEVEQLIERLAMADDALTVPPLAGNPGQEESADARDLASQPPVVRYVTLLIREAHDAGASDIHLEASATGLSARFRLDGNLIPAPDPPAGLHHAILSRVKLLAQLDIAERRRSQDGRIRVRLVQRDLDLRVSTVPTLHGESVVLRLLDQGGRPVALAELGLQPTTLATVLRIAGRPHGLLLVTGPTGSGKTTTLYAALSQRDTSREKVITVEDPVEYQVPGVTQVPVRPETGTTFATALRAILRQDPDVLMIGEMRDLETAELAIQAALTGHLVFATLHTNDALGAIPRLRDLGIPDYLIAATVDAVLAQRLVRRVCGGCATAEPMGSPAAASIAGPGCRDCRGTGFRGRIGIFELLEIRDDFRDAVARGSGRHELRELAERAGFRPMREDGLAKVSARLTTLAEVLRAVAA